MRLVHGDELFLLHTLDQAFNQFLHSAVGLHLFQALAHVVVEKVSHFKRLLDGLAQSVQRMFVHLLKIHGVILEAGLQHVVRESAEQVFQAHFVREVGYVFGESGVLHFFLVPSEERDPIS